MTTKTRRTTITIERHEVTATRQTHTRVPVYCDRCQAEVAGLIPNHTADELADGSIEIAAISQPGEFHYITTSDGSPPLICDGRTEDTNSFINSRRKS